LEAKDAAEAVRNLQLAADQGDVLAQNILGTMYAAGVGIPKDAAEAVRYFQLAADQGHASAQHSLGLMYDAGEGVAQDDPEAVRWLQLAADQGEAVPQHDLGEMYADGRGGLPQDDVTACMWYTLACAREPELISSEEASGVRKNLEQRMTHAQVTEAQRLATEFEAAHPREP